MAIAFFIEGDSTLAAPAAIDPTGIAVAQAKN
jgi:hypothetical protein